MDRDLIQRMERNGFVFKYDQPHDYEHIDDVIRPKDVCKNCEYVAMYSQRDEGGMKVCIGADCKPCPAAEKIYSEPTLDELIGKCGDQFSTLSRYRDGWRAWGCDGESDGYGLTSKDAVGELWLQLFPIRRKINV